MSDDNEQQLQHDIYYFERMAEELSANSPTLLRIIEMARQDRDDVVNEIAMANPSDTAALLDLQFQLRIYSAIPAYIAVLHQRGEDALRATEEETID